MEIFVAATGVEAHLVRSLLEEHGIRAEVRNETLAQVYGELPLDRSTAPAVWIVDDARADEARRVVSHYVTRGHAATLATEIDDERQESRSSPPAIPDELVRSTVVEVILVIVAIFGLTYLYTVQLWITGEAAVWSYMTAADAAYQAVLLAQAFAVLWLVRRWRSEPWSIFGLRRPNRWDLPLGLLLLAGSLVVSVLMYVLVYGSWTPIRSPPVLGDTAWTALFAVLTFGFGAVQEELVWRGYVLTRVEQVSESPLFAVLASSAAFGLYHFVWGTFEGFDSMAFGVLMGVAFLLLRRIWPLAIGHALWNLVTTGW